MGCCSAFGCKSGYDGQDARSRTPFARRRNYWINAICRISRQNLFPTKVPNCVCYITLMIRLSRHRKTPVHDELNKKELQILKESENSTGGYCF